MLNTTLSGGYIMTYCRFYLFEAKHLKYPACEGNQAIDHNC